MIYLLMIAGFLAYCYCIIKFEQLTKIARLIAIRKNLPDEKYHIPFLARLFPSNLKEKIASSKKINATSVKIPIGWYKGLSKLLGVICLASLLFSVLQFWLDHSKSPDVTKATVLQIEEAQHAILHFIKPLKPAFGWDLVITICLIAFAGSFPLLEQWKIKSRYKSFLKLLSTTTFILTIFTSFTFFGNRLYENEQGRVGRLQMHKLEIIKKNQLLLHDIQQAVEDEVIKAYTETEEVKKVFDDNNQYISQRQLLTNDSAITAIIGHLPITFINSAKQVIANTFGNGYDFSGEFEQAEQKFIVACNSEYNDYINYYEFIDKKSKEAYTKSSWYEVKNFSQPKAEEARSVFETATESVRFQHSSNLFEKYQEPFRKTIKKTYGISLEKWINGFFESIDVDFPFMSELLDPLVHEPLQDFMVEKTGKIFQLSLAGNIDAIKEELKATYSKASEAFRKIIPERAKLLNLLNNFNSKLLKIKDIKSLVTPEINKLKQQALYKYAQLDWNGEYETVRRQFYLSLQEGDYPLLTGEKREVFKKAFDDWYSYTQNNKLEIGSNDYKDVEDVFIDYCRDNPDMTACWGYIVLNHDLESIEAKFPTATHLRPYEGLIYYFGKYGYDEVSVQNQFYTEDCNEYVAKACPYTP